MENVAGIAIIVVGVYIAVVFSRGTQGSVFGGLFANTNTGNNSGVPPDQWAGVATPPPDPGPPPPQPPEPPGGRGPRTLGSSLGYGV